MLNPDVWIWVFVGLLATFGLWGAACLAWWVLSWVGDRKDATHWRDIWGGM